MSEFIEDNENDDSDDDLYVHHSITVDKGQTLLRIDKFLIDRVPQISRNRIQNAAKAGALLVNENPVKSNYKVHPGDEIKLLLPHPQREIEILPENIPLNIVHEDEEVMVINKPAGLVVHPGYGNYTGTLVNALAFYLDNLPTKNEYDRPGIVHRLDKLTSGLMVIAKTDLAMNSLAKQFFNRTTKRSYYALVWGNLDEEEGTIEGNIGRNLRNRKVMDVFPDGNLGKHAVTHYKVIERFDYVTLVECRLKTGRTHQIRVHFKYIGHPLFGDFEYGGDRILKGTYFSKYKQFVTNCFSILPRQALHAKSLGFMHPVSKKELFFESEIPEDLETVIEKWRTYISNRIV